MTSANEGVSNAELNDELIEYLTFPSVLVEIAEKVRYKKENII